MMIPWTAAIIGAYCIVWLADMITPKRENGTSKVGSLAVLAIFLILFALYMIFDASLRVEGQMPRIPL